MQQNPGQLIEPLLDIATRAGEAILAIYNTHFSVETKEDASPLTAADKASHQTIVGSLAKLTPGIPILSEESAVIGWAERSVWTEYWLIDPLDGTKEFIKRNGEFTVNIALIQDHRPVLGIVYAPVLRRCFYGYKDGGAFERGPAGEVHPITVVLRAQEPLRVVGSRSHRGELLDGYLARLGDHIMVPMGSSLKFCLVATGEADIYPRLGPTSEWDTAAAQAVVECAGGQVVNLDGQPLMYNTRESLLNPHFLVYGDTGRTWAT
jgi:3'(2'), 5'-bisphosphate nucleotidase